MILCTVQAAMNGIKGKLGQSEAALASDETEALQSEAACLSAEMESLQQLHGFQLSSEEKQTSTVEPASPKAPNINEGKLQSLGETTPSIGSIEFLQKKAGLGKETSGVEEGSAGMQGSLLSAPGVYQTYRQVPILLLA